MTAFRADTPPGRDDGSVQVLGIADAGDIKRQHADAANDAERRWAIDTVGTTAAAAAEHEAERQRATEERNAAQAARVAASGGTTVTSALRGGIGEAVADVLRLDLIDGTFRRIENSIADERAAIIARGGPAPAAQHLREVVTAAVEQAQTKKGSVPSVIGEHLRWLYSRHADEPLGHQLTLALAELRVQQAAARHERIVDRLPEVDTIVVEFATNVLDAARAAAATLESAGLSPDSTSDEVLAALDLDAQKAWHAWRTAVGDWSDVQSARRYVIEALKGRGPTQAKGSYALTAAPGVDTAAEVWSTQFVGVSLPRWVSDAHSALKYAVDEGSDLTPAGVSN